MEPPKLAAWIETFTGKQLHFLEPKQDEIDIEDIAQALASECRFGGHTSAFYSVAEHSILVATVCPPELQLAGLLHDASEAYLRDIASPIKQYLTNYKELEQNLMKAIGQKFNLTLEQLNDSKVKEADTMALKAEARALLPSKGASWIHLYPTDREIELVPQCFAPNVARQVFMAAYRDLTGRAEIIVPERKLVIAR